MSLLVWASVSLLKHGQALQLGDPVMPGPLHTRAGVHCVPGEDPGLPSPSPTDSCQGVARVGVGFLTTHLLLTDVCLSPPSTPATHTREAGPAPLSLTASSSRRRLRCILRSRRCSRVLCVRLACAGTQQRGQCASSSGYPAREPGQESERFLGRIVARNSRKMAMRAKSKSCHDLSVL